MTDATGSEKAIAFGFNVLEAIAQADGFGLSEGEVSSVADITGRISRLLQRLQREAERETANRADIALLARLAAFGVGASEWDAEPERVGLAQALYFQLFPDRVPEVVDSGLPGASESPPGGGVPTAAEAAQAEAVGAALEGALQSGRMCCCPPVPFLIDARRTPAGAETPVAVFDLSDRGDAELLEAARRCGRGEVAPMSRLFWRRMAAAGAALGLGKYNEDRLVYQSDHFAGDPVVARTLHLGVDLFCAAGTPVLAVCDGVVHSVANNTRVQDYGPTVILEHALPAASDAAGLAGGGRQGPPWYSLYGHLQVRTLALSTPGRAVRKGELLGWVGAECENGGWPPHLHLQVMTHAELGGWRGDYPGVCRPADAGVFLAVCRDPNWLLGCRALGYKS